MGGRDGLFNSSEGAHEVAIDEQRPYLLPDVLSRTAVPHGRIGQGDPGPAPQDRGDRVSCRWAVGPALDPVHSNVGLDAGRAGIQPTCLVASWPGRDHRAELVAPHRELRQLDHVAVAEVCDAGVSDEDLHGAIELVE